jgi:hypothetical protein
VGNGSKAPTGWHRTWWHIPSKGIASVRDESNKSSNGDGSNSANLKRTRRHWEVLVPRNPFFGVRIMFYKNTALVLFMASIFYATYYCVQTSIPVIYESVYSFNVFQVGLAYLPGGVGVMVITSSTGRLMDHNYKITAAQVGHEIDKIKGDNIDEFPIEKARTRLSLPFLAIFTATFIGYGLAIEAHTHCAVPLLLQSVLGLLIMIFNTTYSALLVDIFPANSSAVATTGNPAICELSQPKSCSVRSGPGGADVRDNMVCHVDTQIRSDLPSQQNHYSSGRKT